MRRRTLVRTIAAAIGALATRRAGLAQAGAGAPATAEGVNVTENAMAGYAPVNGLDRYYDTDWLGGPTPP